MSNRWRLRLILTLLIVGAMLPAKPASQNVSPVDISAFHGDKQIRAVVTDLSISECKGAAETKEYQEHIATTLRFQNRSARPVLLYKNSDPWATERIAASEKDIAQHKYVAGYTGHRVALTQKPKKVSIDDFEVLNPGGSYSAKIRVTVFASADLKLPLVHSGEYWIQLGVDARPDEFYLDGRAKANFADRWRSRGHIAEFILADPFPIEIRLNPSVPACDRIP